MSIGSLIVPDDRPLGYSPFSANPQPSYVVQQAFTPPAASSPVQVGVFIKTLVLTDAQLKVMNATPVNMGVAVAGHIVVPISLKITAIVTTPFSATGTINVKYVGAGSNVMSMGSMLWSSPANPRFGVATATAFTGTTDQTGVDLQLQSGVTLGPAGATSGGTAVTLTYAVV